MYISACGAPSKYPFSTVWLCHSICKTLIYIWSGIEFCFCMYSLVQCSVDLIENLVCGYLRWRFMLRCCKNYLPVSGRGGYHRSASYSDEHGGSGENRSGGFPYYGRGGGAAGSSGVGGGGGGGDHWVPPDGGTGASRGGGGVGAGTVGGGGVGGAYTPTGGPPGGGSGSRASRDGNWRSPSTPQTDDPATTPEWGSHWHPPPSPASTYNQGPMSTCICPWYNIMHIMVAMITI